MDDYKIHQGDAWQLAKTLPDQSIQTIITSPPYYGLRDYGTAEWEGSDPACDHLAPPRGGRDPATSSKQLTSAGTLTYQYVGVCEKCGAKRVDSQFGLEATPEEYVDKLVALFRELRRALRDDGTLWINIGDSYNGSGGAGGDYGAGGLKEGQPRYPGRNVGSLKPKDLCGIPWRVAFGLQADGWYLRSDIIWAKNNPMPESVRDRPTKAHEYIFLLSKNQRYFYDADAVREPYQESSIERYKYSALPSSGKWMPHVLVGGEGNRASNGVTRTTAGLKSHEQEQNPLGRNRRSVWNVNTSPYKGAHFATFPPKLIEPCVLAGCPPGEIVLDPFMGSGTTAVVALALGRQAVGFELNPEYIALADARIAASRVVKKVASPKLESQLDGLPLFTKLLKGERSNVR